MILVSLLFIALTHPAAIPNKPLGDAGRVLVVINQASPESLTIGSYYARMRHIPHDQVVFVNVVATDNISMADYMKGVQTPVADAIAKHRGIDFIVTTKGVPIRLNDDGGYSLDGHLATMDLKLDPITKLDDSDIARCISPYYRKNEAFSHAKFGFYLVTRLDGYTVADARALVDHSIAAKAEKGPFFFDSAGNRKGGGYGEMDRSLIHANEVLKAKGLDTSVDETPEFVLPPRPLAGYASWGSNDGAYDEAKYRKIRFKPGALCETFVSTSGRSFSHQSGGQSMIADLIASGVTGVKGYVSEPYTFALARPDILFDRYTSGFNLAESFYMASPVLKWKDVVIGDPLCSPYGGVKSEE